MLKWLTAVMYLASRLHKIDTNNERLSTRMATLEAQFNTLLAEIDSTTDNIAAEFDALRAELTTIRENGGMTASTEASLAARLTTQIERLKAIGKTPVVTPTEPPVEPIPSEPSGPVSTSADDTEDN